MIAVLCFVLIWAATVGTVCWAISRQPYKPKPGYATDVFGPDTGHPGLDRALTLYFYDPTDTNEAEVTRQTQAAEDAVEVCFPY